ncbi:MAG TPA: 3-deoxy-D-manno-octulosonic acid kinase [Patescibacteria group bacterium]|nr:3-deoxy-D-manno-octulosonic acid kinase [Patescibacteria group bacterium]
MNDATGVVRTVLEHVQIDRHSGLIHPAALDSASVVALFGGSGELQEGRGRGAIRVVDAPIGRVVVRHYRRGGLIARLSRDWFFWNGADATRPFREFRITVQLRAAGLPVPEAMAARYLRTGLGYRADLATREIPGARTLADRLADTVDRATIDWCAIGTLIARFHALGLWHADLNAHNLLFDRDGRLSLIDFDRARFIAPFSTSLQGNLDRLARSLRKLGHGDRVAGDDWVHLRQGYEAAMHRLAGCR